MTKNLMLLKHDRFRLTAAGTTALKFCLLPFAILLLSTRLAHALAVTGVSFSDTNILYETGGLPNGTTISFTIDTQGQVQVAINCGIQNFGDAGTNVANLIQTYS